MAHKAQSGERSPRGAAVERGVPALRPAPPAPNPKGGCFWDGAQREAQSTPGTPEGKGFPGPPPPPPDKPSQDFLPFLFLGSHKPLKMSPRKGSCLRREQPQLHGAQISTPLQLLFA